LCAKIRKDIITVTLTDADDNDVDINVEVEVEIDHDGAVYIDAAKLLENAPIDCDWQEVLNKVIQHYEYPANCIFDSEDLQ
jgi:hypothetical protein